jgi:hypothetical protein
MWIGDIYELYIAYTGKSRIFSYSDKGVEVSEEPWYSFYSWAWDEQRE